MNTLHIIGVILTFIVAIEHLGIAGLEIFGKPETQAKAFDMTVNFVKQKEAKVSMANQGIYNAMLGLVIILSYFMFSGVVLTNVWAILLSFIVVVAIFGGFTATKKIFAIQMLPALIALILILL
ncbi:DUF1304 domain-containing protein [Lactobacillus kalixensis]|uniref:Membrane protein n=1 Tax=Lactobacillus kalixensis DSM 16043 TaxID=1423763 RepID=A0A0R1ULP6_9LACO|nr:DUF1304 domain-containing protein [Lactobacillus kalixensis]KRL90427.1 membrane protein [Lactobacillus kalixensis DSM 16043]